MQFKKLLFFTLVGFFSIEQVYYLYNLCLGQFPQKTLIPHQYLYFNPIASVFDKYKGFFAEIQVHIETSTGQYEFKLIPKKAPNYLEQMQLLGVHHFFYNYKYSTKLVQYWFCQKKWADVKNLLRSDEFPQLVTLSLISYDSNKLLGQKNYECRK